MALAQQWLSTEPNYICHKSPTMSTSYPKVPNLSTEICRIPAVSSIIHKGSLKKIIFPDSFHDAIFLIPNLLEFP